MSKAIYFAELLRYAPHSGSDDWSSSAYRHAVYHTSETTREHKEIQKKTTNELTEAIYTAYANIYAYICNGQQRRRCETDMI